VSYLGIVASSVLVSNALLSYGLGSIPAFRKGPDEDGARTAPGARAASGSAGGLAAAAALAGANSLAAALLWCVRDLVLVPLGLAQLDLLFFAIIAVPLLKALSRAAASAEGLLARVGAQAEELIVGSLVFGVALIAARGGYSLGEAFAAGAASGLGYWMATSLLDSIRERLELSDVPAAFRGAPSMLLSTGLMSMALMGIDTILVRNVGG
jgi:Na+-translocating ferredoxin:NAD+ oxidoreductase subunit A